MNKSFIMYSGISCSIITTLVVGMRVFIYLIFNYVLI